MSDKAETMELMELKLHANRGDWVATVHTDRRTAPWVVKLGKRLYIRTGTIDESSYFYDHAERPLSETELGNAMDANESVEVKRVEYAGTGVRTTGEVVGGAEPNPAPSALDELDEAHATIAALTAERDEATERYRLEAESRNADAATWKHNCERLTAELNSEKAAHEVTKSVVGRISPENTSLRVKIDRLHCEIDRQQNLNFEAQDRYAALEAERDELRAKLEAKDSVLGVTREHRDDIEHRWHGERTRAEKYLAVIRAKDLELFYTVLARSAALKACAAMAEAGLPLHVIEEADCD